LRVLIDYHHPQIGKSIKESKEIAHVRHTNKKPSLKCNGNRIWKAKTKD
jgi:hypothetical protein